MTPNQPVESDKTIAQGQAAQAGLEEFLNKDRPETVGAGQSVMTSPSEDVAKAAATQPKSYLEEMLSQQPRQTKMEENDLYSLLDNQPEVGKEIVNQVPNPTPKMTVPAGQNQGVYGDIAKKIIESQLVPKTPPVQLVTDETGMQKFVPKVVGEVGRKMSKPIVKAEVQPDNTVANVWYDANDQTKPGVVRGKVRDPLQVAIARAEAFGNNRTQVMFDAENMYEPRLLKMGQIEQENNNRQSQGMPPKWVPRSGTEQALEKTALIADMQRTIDRVNELIPRVKFDAAAAGQASEMLRVVNDKEAFGRMLQYAIGKTLTPDQGEYLIALAQLQENSLALRSVLKAGPGSDQLREKILATLPSGSTPSAKYATEQVKQYEAMLHALSRGVPNVKLNPPRRIGEASSTVLQPEEKKTGKFKKLDGESLSDYLARAKAAGL